MCYHLIPSTRSRCKLLPEQNNLTVSAPGRGLSHSDLFLCFRWESSSTLATNRRRCSPARRFPSASSTSSPTNWGTCASRSPIRPRRRSSLFRSVRAFATGLEKAMDTGPLAIARHLTRHASVLAETGREHDLAVTFYIQRLRTRPPRQIRYLHLHAPPLNSRSDQGTRLQFTRLSFHKPWWYPPNLLRRNYKTIAQIKLIGSAAMMTSTHASSGSSSATSARAAPHGKNRTTLITVPDATAWTPPDL